MNSPITNPDQPKIVLFYSTLTVGFVFLLTLIWMIGSRSVDELQAISFAASDISADYQRRLSLAGKIRDQEVNYIAQVNISYATGHNIVPILPYTRTFKEAKDVFTDAVEEGKKLWGQRDEQRFVTPAELAAWRRIEAAVPNFIVAIENLLAVNDKKSAKFSGGGNGDFELDVSKLNHDAFVNARLELDKAVADLSSAIVADQSVILNRIASQQRSAATQISITRWGAFSVGLFVALIVFTITRSQILELRRAILSAQNAQDFARSVFDSQTNDILVIAENGEMLAVNQAFFKHYHLSPSELFLQDYRGALAHMPEVANFIGKTLELSDKNASHRERIEVKIKRGMRQSQSFPSTSRLFDVYISPLTIGQETRGRVVVMVDVTEAEQVREELRRNRTLSAVGQITAQVAHELYNPIGAVKLNIELLEMQMANADDDLKHSVARLKRGAEHLSTIVMDLRYLTRPRDPERKPTNLNKLLDEVIELAGDRLERARTLVVRNYTPEPVQGNFDPQQLRKVFLNLLINAVEASPPNSQVQLQTSFIEKNTNGIEAERANERGDLVISVTDHGSGMSEETRNRIFEAFYTTKRNGTGLGMMITQEIVKKHNGRIEIESEEGKGTTVSVFLPV